MLPFGITHRPILVFAILSFLHACGGSSSGSGSSSSSSSSSSGSSNAVPTLNLPASFEWEENQAFTYTIPANDDGELTYSVAPSTDAALFTLDANTGLLSASAAFDFESPTDANQDGIFELSITVSDQQGETASGSLIINVQNVEEYEALVTFPVPGSNIGGKETSFNIRGYLNVDGVKRTTQAEGIVVKVGDIAAEFENDNSGYWIAEIPVQPGSNNFNLAVMQENEVIFSDTFNVQNEPIENVDTRVTDGTSSIYAISFDKTFILKTEISSGNTEIIAANTDFSSQANCESFTDILISPDGNTLSVLCSDTINEVTVVAFINLENKELQSVVIYYDLSNRYFIEWVQNDHLLIRPAIDEIPPFYLIRVADGLIKEFGVTFAETQDGYISKSNLFVDDETVYLTAIRTDPITSYEYVWASFGLSSIINGDINSIEAVEEPQLDFNNSFKLFAKDGFAYRPLENTLQKTNLDTGEVTSIPFMSSDGEPVDISGLIVFVGNDYAVLSTVLLVGLYNISLSTGISSEVVSSPKIQNNVFSSLNADQSEWAAYSNLDRKVTKIDLSNYEIIESQDLTDSSFYSEVNFEHATFDQDNNTLYRTNLQSWGGTPPNDNPIILAYDLENQTDTPLITSNDLQNHLNLSNPLFTFGRPIETDDSNVLWFSVLIYEQPILNHHDAIFSLNIETKEISTLYFSTYSEDANEFSPPIPSPYYPELNGIILTTSSYGFVKILESTGDTETLIEERNPFRSTLPSGFDSATNLIYFSGAYEGDETGYTDFNSTEIVEYNRDTQEQRIVASPTQGNGLNIIGIDTIDTQRKLVYGVTDGNLVIIDLYTGDRVVKKLD